MITMLFSLANEKILVTVNGKKVTFANTSYGAKESEIDGLQLSYQGVIKQFPDLKDKENWKKESIKRFKAKLNTFSTEMQIAEYIIFELKNQGYKPEKIQREGYRPRNI